MYGNFFYKIGLIYLAKSLFKDKTVFIIVNSD